MTHISTNPNILQMYQASLYQRALHPELFNLQDRLVIRHGEYEFEAWLMPGEHVFRFERGGWCACELVSDREAGMPQAGIVDTFYCAGEHEYEHVFKSQNAAYLANVQTEQLSENIYLATVQEMREHASAENAMSYEWEDEAGPCLSVLDIQRYSREVHAQAYHLLARGGVVLRTQSIFELR
ncbi:MAG: hypothetical protein ACIARR_13450 [Phycisphaerales bacterium JB059]